MLPTMVAWSCSHCERMRARRILTCDFEVTFIIGRDHLSINSVSTQCIYYLREKSFNFFIQDLLDKVINF